MHHILIIFTNHIATSQFAAIKSQVTGVYMIKNNTKKEQELRGNWLKLRVNRPYIKEVTYKVI